MQQPERTATLPWIWGEISRYSHTIRRPPEHSALTRPGWVKLPNDLAGVIQQHLHSSEQHGASESLGFIQQQGSGHDLYVVDDGSNRDNPPGPPVVHFLYNKEIEMILPPAYEAGGSLLVRYETTIVSESDNSGGDRAFD